VSLNYPHRIQPAKLARWSRSPITWTQCSTNPTATNFSSGSFFTSFFLYISVYAKHNSYYRLNLKTKEASKTDLHYRPDGLMVLNEELNDVYTLGFCEIKSSDAMNRYNLTHTDTFRLVTFAKNAIDGNYIRCTIAVQSVGKYILPKCLHYDTASHSETYLCFVL
jgi:hypothetical protein